MILTATPLTLKSSAAGMGTAPTTRCASRRKGLACPSYPSQMAMLRIFGVASVGSARPATTRPAPMNVRVMARRPPFFFFAFASSLTTSHAPTQTHRPAANGRVRGGEGVHQGKWVCLLGAARVFVRRKGAPLPPLYGQFHARHCRGVWGGALAWVFF